MSSKQSNSKPDPRIAKKEVMVTRHKSAQMKRQLRVKDRSMKHITDLLKSPTKETHTKSVQTKTKSPPKLKQSLLKSIEKVQKLPEKVFRLSKVLRKKVALVRDEEYYPNKRKRKVEVNRVVLKPTHDLKLVGSITGSVKRKYAVPHKASKSSPSPKPSSPVYAELSMAEVLRIMEDDLTDEDMMEILTCPSPVWWEDPPDEEYIEEAIFRRTPEPPETHKQAVEEKIDMDVDKPIEVTNLDARGDKFLKKRSKLEGLLGHIKNKTNNKIRQCDRNAFNEDLVVICSGYRRNENDSEVKSARKQTNSESDDDIFQDSSMNVDEFLNQLENMVIPMEDNPTEVIVIEDDDECKKEQKRRLKKDVVKMKSGSDETLNVLKNVPVLKKYRLDKIASPKSFESSSSKTSRDCKDIDSISDTNVKFILDEEVDEQNEVNIKVVNIKQEPKQNPETFQVNKEPFVDEKATYGIIKDTIENSKEANERKNDDKERMNDYYKTCKKATQKKITAKTNEVDNTDINKNGLAQDTVAVKIESDTFMLCEACKPQTKKVSDDKNVKYCLKCSSIFDSTDCAYCIEKSKSNVYKCVSCKLKFCCEDYFNAHTLSHLEVGLRTK